MDFRALLRSVSTTCHFEVPNQGGFNVNTMRLPKSKAVEIQGAELEASRRLCET